MTRNAVRTVDWFEIKRKIIHICTGLIIAGLIYLNILQPWMVAALLLLGVAVSFICIYFDLPIIAWFLKKFERKEYIKRFPGRGVIYLFLGILILMLLFQKNIVLASIMIWAFGDSVSAIVGKHYGTRVHPLNDNRLIEGTIAGIIVGAVAASFFVIWYAAIIASLIAMTLESIELKLLRHPIDDNLLVPLTSGIILSIIYLL